MDSSTSQREENDQRANQTGRYVWIMLPIITGAVVAQSLVAQGLPVLYPFIQSEFRLSRAQVGLITSSYAIGFGASVTFAGWLTDSLGVKRMVMVAAFSITTLTLIFPLAYSFPIILALASVIGIVSSPMYPATTRAVMEWFPSRIRGLAMGLKQTGFPIGGTLTAALLPVLTLLIGWRMAAASMGLLVLLIAIMFILMYRDTQSGRKVVRKFSFTTLRAILRNRHLVITIIWGATLSGLQYVVLSYLMLFFIEELGTSPIMAGGLLAIVQVSSGIGRVLWGAASDFIFRGRRIPVMAIMGFLAVLWMLGASFIYLGVPNAILYLMAVFIGISTLSYPGVLTTLIGEQAGSQWVGVTVGVSSMVNHASQMAMPPLFGYLVDVSSSYSLGWRVTAAVALVPTLALVGFVREPQHN